jgi:hypothetical protein
MKKSIYSVVPFVAAVFILVATAVPAAAGSGEAVEISNHSDANVHYVVDTGLGKVQGCLVSGGSFSNPILQLVKDVSFTFYRGSRWTCSGTVVHTAKLPYKAPRSSYAASGNGRYVITVSH